MINIKHTRTEVTVTKLIPVPMCPICRERRVKVRGGKPRSTCGHYLCQYKHHILVMRKRRKTERLCLVRRIEV